MYENLSNVKFRLCRPLSRRAREATGQATASALVSFFNFVPMILFTPLAGVLVDRWNRKLVGTRARALREAPGAFLGFLGA